MFPELALTLRCLQLPQPKRDLRWDLRERALTYAFNTGTIALCIRLQTGNDPGLILFVQDVREI